MKSYVEMIRSYTKDGLKKINTELRKVIKTEINPNMEHIIDRIQQRDIEAAELRETLDVFATRGLCEFLYLISLRVEQRPFRIFVSYRHVILQLSRMDDNWVLSTVLNAKQHNKHADEFNSSFYAYILLDEQTRGF